MEDGIKARKENLDADDHLNSMVNRMVEWIRRQNVYQNDVEVTGGGEVTAG